PRSSARLSAAPRTAGSSPKRASGGRWGRRAAATAGYSRWASSPVNAVARLRVVYGGEQSQPSGYQRLVRAGRGDRPLAEPRRKARPRRDHAARPGRYGSVAVELASEELRADGQPDGLYGLHRRQLRRVRGIWRPGVDLPAK